MEDVPGMTHEKFIGAFLDSDTTLTVQEKIAKRFHLAQQGPELVKLAWSGFFDSTAVALQTGTPAEILEHILNKRWHLKEADRDMIVMWHRFRFQKEGKERQIQASLIALGENSTQTAMAKTVGLPLGLAAKELLNGKVMGRGVLVPTTKEFYEPILRGLSTHGIELIESVG